MEVRLIRKTRRWDLSDPALFSSANVVDLTCLAPSHMKPNDVYDICYEQIKGFSSLSLLYFSEIIQNFRRRRIDHASSIIAIFKPSLY